MHAPLYRLLQKDTKWNWGKDQQEAFERAKDIVQSSTLLVHYDPKRQLVLTCDASPFGIGAVLAHIMDDGSERPVGYASKTLSQAEKGYSQLDKEALAIVFGVTKFHSYLYGRPLPYILTTNLSCICFVNIKAYQQWHQQDSLGGQLH